jgi:hypothetical protein
VSCGVGCGIGDIDVDSSISDIDDADDAGGGGGGGGGGCPPPLPPAGPVPFVDVPLLYGGVKLTAAGFTPNGIAGGG